MKGEAESSAARGPSEQGEDPPKVLLRSRAERRARRRWYPISTVLLEALMAAGLVAHQEKHLLIIQTTRALPDRLLSIKTDPDHGMTAQPAWPRSEYRSPEYCALAVKQQITISAGLKRLRRDGQTDRFVALVMEAAAALGVEDQKVVDLERANRGGTLPEKRERRVSVRTVSGGLPTLGKRR